MLVMFDLDGTLVDTSELYLAGVPLIVRGHLGRTIDVEEYTDLWGHDVRAWFVRAAGAREALVDAMYADFESFYIANHPDCAVYEGVAEGLASLKDLGHTLGVVTTRPQRRAELVYDFDWAASIDFVIGGDRVARRKPFPDSLDLSVDQYRTAGTERTTVYVGDNALDIQAARASRHPIVSVAALWGARDRAALLAARPDRQFDRFSEFAAWLSSHKETSWAHPSLPN